MKTASPALIALLATGEFIRADLWTIVLSGGTTIHWSSQDIPITFSGTTWIKGPAIDRGTISEKVGVEICTLEMDITGTANDKINGVPVISFIRGHGLDGALITLQRGYGPDWASPLTGLITRFVGTVTDTKNQGITSKLTISDRKYLLGYPAPRNGYQVPCGRVLYDSQCGVNPVTYQQTNAVVHATTNTLSSGLVNASGYFAQGRILFTSGANQGLTRTVKTDDGAGNLTLIFPLPNAPAAGDTFTVQAGCDLTQSTCQNKFNNLLKFKATPFVPAPSVITGTNTYTPTGSK